MDFNEALDLLDLNKFYTEKELRKSYYKKALIYHPDKYNDNGDKFKKIKEAYEILLERLQLKTNFKNKEDKNYVTILKNYIDIIAEKYKWNNVIFLDSIIDIITNTKNISLKLFEALSKEQCLDLFDAVNKYKDVFNISEELINEMKTIINKKYNDIEIIILNPSLTDLYENNIYVLERNNKNLYIPLWHNELYFDEIIVLINPELPKHINIDEYNNIHIHININIHDLINKKYFNIDITENIQIDLNTNELYCKKYQKYIVKNKGISIINENNLFDISLKSDIILHITAI